MTKHEPVDVCLRSIRPASASSSIEVHTSGCWRIACAAAVLLFSLAPGGALALSIVPNPFSVTFFPGVEGQVELLSVESGAPVGGTVTLGVVSPGDVTLVLRGSLDPGSLPGNSLSLWIEDGSGVVPFTGAGTLPGADTGFLFSGSSVSHRVTFTPPELVGGTVLNPVFLSFAGPLATDGSLTLHASFITEGQQGGSATLVPEPGSGVLMMLGLAALGCRRRRVGAEPSDGPAPGVAHGLASCPLPRRGPAPYARDSSHIHWSAA